MSYKRLKEQEKQLTEEIESLIQQAEQCDEEEDQAYKDRTGYEVPEDLQHKETRRKKIQEAKEALEKREAELNPGKPIEDKKQISFADHDARIMGKNGQYDYAYNGQISVDADNQIIVGQHVSQNANDTKEVAPALEEIKETTHTMPDKASLDNGYFSGDNLEAFKEAELDAYVAIGKGEKQDDRETEKSNRKFKKSDFNYDEETDGFTCPAGERLPLRSNGKHGTKSYQASEELCNQCEHFKRCSDSKKGASRIITTDEKEPLRREMIEKMQQESSRKVYAKRKEIVEPVFGQIKNSGFRKFSVRGSPKVEGEFSLVCATHNFKKIVKAIYRGVVCFESGELAPMVA